MKRLLRDNFGREFHYLRLSITDACNFKCGYCLPNGYQTKPATKYLALNEIKHLLEAFAQVGCRKVRLTGGEPSLRKDFPDIISLTAQTKGIDIVAATTNGFRLKRDVKTWFDAGLRRLNLSIDSLNPYVFHSITGANKLHDILTGIDEALALGYERIKINVVLLKDINDTQLPAFLKWIEDKPIDLRFIELMETGQGSDYFKQHFTSGELVKKTLLEQGWVRETHVEFDGPAQNFAHAQSLGRIGLIMPYSKDFCASCNRLRVSSTGQLHLCLFGEEGIDLRDLLQSEDSKAPLIAQLHASLKLKKATHFLHEGHTGVREHLASIGG